MGEEPRVQDLIIPLICIACFFFSARTHHPAVISEVLQCACKVGRDAIDCPNSIARNTPIDRATDPCKATGWY